MFVVELFVAAKLFVAVALVTVRLVIVEEDEVKSEIVPVPTVRPLMFAVVTVRSLIVVVARLDVPVTVKVLVTTASVVVELVTVSPVIAARLLSKKMVNYWFPIPRPYLILRVME